MEKIKLSSYGKKQGKSNEIGGSNFYETDPIMTNTETRLNKYNLSNDRQTKKNSEQVEKIQKFREDFAKI